MATPETAHLTVDVALFAQDGDGQWRVLMIRRGWEPFKDHWALPGGQVDAGEYVAVAARRELAEETGLSIGSVALRRVGVYDDPGRDPRGRYVTFASTAVLPEMTAPTAGDDAVEARWLTVDQVVLDTDLPVAFDHRAIVRDAMHVAL